MTWPTPEDLGYAVMLLAVGTGIGRLWALLRSPLDRIRRDLEEVSGQVALHHRVLVEADAGGRSVLDRLDAIEGRLSDLGSEQADALGRILDAVAAMRADDGG